MLVMAVITTCCVIAGASASAVTGKVYFDNSVTHFDTPYCYMWGGSSGANKDWPGIAMTKVDGDIWSYDVNGDYTSIIFNKGSNEYQSNDLSFTGVGKVAA